MTGKPGSGEVARLALGTPGSPRTSEIAIGRGLSGELDRLLAEVGEPGARYAIISDDTVAGLHGERIAEGLRSGGRTVDLLTFPAGETSKTPGQWSSLVERLGGLGFGRDGCVIAVGGGVTGDLAGFVAATFARGVPFVQVPTSLVAMIDASVGGKTGVDLGAGKNLVGAFHQPRLVVVDPSLLDTLAPEQLRAGLSEAVKHGAIADAAYFRAVQEDAPALLRGDPPAVGRLIQGSIRIKAAVVARDALESGERAILNFGHTVAHGIEQATGYAVGHGPAVAIGMVAEAAIGERAGLTEPGTSELLRAPLEALGLPVTLPDGVTPSAVLDAAASDKKNRAGSIRYALIKEIGRAARSREGAWTVAVEDEVVRAALASG